MEELEKNIFIQFALPQQFSRPHWTAITEETPQRFQAKQNMMLELLKRDSSLKQKYFQKFEKNHLTLYAWYLLASREKVEIQPYLFRPILQKTPAFENFKVSKAVNSQFPHRNTRVEPNKVRKLMINSHSCKEKEREEEEVNGHELYLQTFAACRGQHYIPYDYSKHMRSEMEKSSYNAYIRQKHKNHTQNLTAPEHVLSRYKEWAQAKQKKNPICFRAILGNVSLNSQRGLQSLLKRHGSHKLVFINHQRKPVNYYIRSRKSQLKL